MRTTWPSIAILSLLQTFAGAQIQGGKPKEEERRKRENEVKHGASFCYKTSVGWKP